MIKKSLFVFLASFFLYSLFIFLKPKLHTSQTIWQDNLIKAQKYIYNESDSLNNIIIGSSMAAHLIMDSLPNFYNLSFGGQSVFDGLRILKTKNKLPKNVFIETNVVLLGESKDFTSSLFSPVLFFPRKHFLSLRADKQPIGIFIGYLTALDIMIDNKIQASKETTKPNPEVSELKKTEKPILKQNELFNQAIKLKIDEYSIRPDKILLEKQLLLLAEYVKYLKNKGVNVYFFEMPVNSHLIELPKSKIIREEIYKLFPSDSVYYILPDRRLYETSDGIHLDIMEATKYTTYFKSRIK